MKGWLLILSLSVFLFFTGSCSKDGESEYIPPYVDLGLSVKWATCNVRASQPQEYGDYYAWGETNTKDHFFWST